MASDDSWIDRARIQALARSTAWHEPEAGVPRPQQALTAIRVPPTPDVDAPSSDVVPPVPEPDLSEELRSDLAELLTWSRRSTGLTTGAILRGSGAAVLVQGELELAFLQHVPAFLRWLAALHEPSEGTPPGHLALQLGERFVVTTWHGTLHERFVLLLEGTTPPEPELLTELGLALHDALAPH